jgi:hypothetical protein
VIHDKLQKLVDIQTADEGLWAVPLGRPQRMAEAEMQRALRLLHAVIESRTKNEKRG